MDDKILIKGRDIMEIQFKNLDKTEGFKKLQKSKSVDLKKVLTPQRIQEYQLPMEGGLTYHFATKKVDKEILTTLQGLADEQQVIPKYREILEGSFYNTGENRMVLHHLTRGQQAGDVLHDGKNLGDFYRSVASKIEKFTQEVHSGKRVSSTGKPFKNVVQIGIGGSDLGPRALYLALKNVAPAKLQGHFVSNVDPDDISAMLDDIEIESTLFILVSKSGTTQETLTNLYFVQEYAKKKGVDLTKQIVAVTSATSPLAQSKDFLETFFIDDFIGGRYSSTSAVGGVVLSLAFGFPLFSQFLEGAACSDKQSLNANIWENPALLDALIGVYERNVLKIPSTVVLPYSNALSRFPAHLQQLDMESNGKRVNRGGELLSYQTGPLVWGEPGTNGQHSFYQLLHQGTEVQSLQFIGFKRSQRQTDLEYQGSTSQKKLNANLIAQMVAFSQGEPNSQDRNKDFEGGRPLSLILGDQLGARELGLLLGHFENKVMFQGLLWNLNSFDQEGVQLGKVLTESILKDQGNELLSCYGDLLFS